MFALVSSEMFALVRREIHMSANFRFLRPHHTAQENKSDQSISQKYVYLKDFAEMFLTQSLRKNVSDPTASQKRF